MSFNKKGAVEVEILFSNVASTGLGFLPPNAYVTSVEVLVPVAFDAGTTNVIDVGLGSTADNLADGVDVSSTGAPSVTATAQWGAIQSTQNPTAINAIYIPTGTAATAGNAKVVVNYAFNENE